MSCGFQRCGCKVTKVCSGCRAVGYCGTACQKADWPAHKLQCTARVGASLSSSKSKKSRRSSIDERRMDSDRLWRQVKEAFDDVLEIAQMQERLLRRAEKQDLPKELESDIQKNLGNLEVFVEQYFFSADAFEGKLSALSKECELPERKRDVAKERALVAKEKATEGFKRSSFSARQRADELKEKAEKLRKKLKSNEKA